MCTPLLLDVYCGAGGAGFGYAQAGFAIIGVDIKEHPEYPGIFIKMDALEAITKIGPFVDVIHASPPCQRYSPTTAPYRSEGKTYVDLIANTREAIQEVGKPYIIENVPQSPVRADLDLIGYWFGLDLVRKRRFEISRDFFVPYAPRCKKPGTVRDGTLAQVVGHGKSKGSSKGDQTYRGWKGNTLDTWREVMQMPWAKDLKSLAEAIPPKYTEYIGSYIIKKFLKSGQ